MINGEWIAHSTFSLRAIRRSELHLIGDKKLKFYPMDLEEMHLLDIPTLKNTGFFISEMNPVVDYVAFPLGMIGMRIAPNKLWRPLSRFLSWSSATFAKEPFGILMQIVASNNEGKKYRMEILSDPSDDGYNITVIPMVSIIQQMKDTKFRKSGVFLQGLFGDPEITIQDCEKMGISVYRDYK